MSHLRTLKYVKRFVFKEKVMKVLKKELVAILALVLAACTPVKHSDKSKQEAESLDPGTINQAPQISCLMTVGATRIRSINSLSAADTFENPVHINEIPHLDCTATTDDNDLPSQIVMTLYGNSGIGETLINREGNLLPRSTAGSFPMYITATDSAGKTSRVDFTEFVSCAGVSDIDLSPITGISLTQLGGGDSNFFRYALQGTPTTTAPRTPTEFSYSLDFNGDGAQDLFNILTPRVWSSSGTFDGVYTNFANTRTVRLRVRENRCNFIAETSFSLNFPIGRLPVATPIAAVPTAPFHIQADVSAVSASLNTEKSVNNDFISRHTDALSNQFDPPGAAPVKRIRCRYEKPPGATEANFSISALNTYDNAAAPNANPRLIHGMTLNIRNIAGDTGATSATNVTGNLHSVHYYTAEASDQKPAQDFTNSCSLSDMQVEHLFGMIPCEGGPGLKAGDVIKIKGKFSCPTLNAGVGTIKAENGFFGCEYSVATDCVGGGGGGGDDPPPR